MRSLVVFPETYVPGYPDYIWRLTPGGDYDLSREIHGRLLENAVDLEGEDLRPVRDAAARHGVTVVLGVHERDAAFSRASLFNTLVTIGPDGELLNRHRKLVPTNPERMVWAPGRRERPARARPPVRPARRADLLGELHAARALQPLRAGHRDLRRLDLGQRRRLDRLDAAHRARGSLLGARLRLLDPGEGRPRRLPRTRPALSRSRASGSTRATR